MSKTPWQTTLAVLALFLLPPLAAPAQQEKPSPHSSNSQNAKVEKATGKLPLRSVTLANTTEAARKAAEEEIAREQDPEKASKTAKPEGDKASANAAVLEFHPTAEAPAADSSKGTFKVKGHKKSVLKNIHGSAYGAAASGLGQASGEGGAVGGDSRAGRVNVYVEGEHTHGNTPGPH